MLRGGDVREWEAYALDPSRGLGMTVCKGHVSAHLRLIWVEGTGALVPLDPSTPLTPRRIFDRVNGIPRPSCIPYWGRVRGWG